MHNCTGLYIQLKSPHTMSTIVLVSALASRNKFKESMCSSVQAYTRRRQLACGTARASHDVPTIFCFPRQGDATNLHNSWCQCMDGPAIVKGRRSKGITSKCQQSLLGSTLRQCLRTPRGSFQIFELIKATVPPSSLAGAQTSSAGHGPAIVKGRRSRKQLKNFSSALMYEQVPAEPFGILVFRQHTDQQGKRKTPKEVIPSSTGGRTRIREFACTNITQQ